MELTLDEGFYLYRELVLKEYLDEELPEVPEVDSDILKRIDETVLVQRERFEETQREAEKKEAIYKEHLKVGLHPIGNSCFEQLFECYSCCIQSPAL